MTRTRALLLLALAGCHATATTPSERSSVANTSAPEPAPPVVARDTRPAPAPLPDPGPLPLQHERNDPQGGPCEWSCADVHDCALLSGVYTPSAAASIEVGCLDMCLHSPERATLFGCQRPSTLSGSLEPGTCSPFLDCVAAQWPDARAPAPKPDAPTNEDGCTLGCKGFALCYDPSTTADKIEQCAEICRRALDEQGMQVFAECARLPNCDAVMSCVSTLPGAHSGP